MLLASCGTDIKFHKWPTGNCYGSFHLPEVGTYKPSISWCKEGELLATSMSSSAFATVVYVGKTIQTHMIIDVPQIQALSFSQTTQSHIILGTTKGHILLYDIHQQEVIQSLPCVPAGVTYLEYGRKDSSLAAGCKNEQIYLFNSNYTIISTFCVPHSNNLTAMAYHNIQTNLLAAAGGEGTLVVWDVNTGNTKVIEKAHSDVITDLAFSGDNEIVTVGLDNKFNSHDLRTQSSIFSCLIDTKLSAVRTLPTSEQMAVASIDGKLYCYDKRNIKSPFNIILSHYPSIISRMAFQSSYIIPEVPNKITQSGREIVITPQSKPIHKSIVEDANSVKERFSSSDFYAPASGDHKLENIKSNHFATFIPFSFKKNSCSTHAINSYTNFRQLPINKFLNLQKGFTDIQKNISCTRKETKRKFENDVKLVQTRTLTNWFEQLSKYHSDTNLNENGDISETVKELVDFTKDTFDRLNEFITKEFVKIRWSISKGFIKLENKINIRWEELNSTFIQLSGCEILEDMDDAKIDCCSEKNKAEKPEEDDNCGGEQKSRIPVLNLPIK